MDQQSPRKAAQTSAMSSYYSNFMNVFNRALKSKSEWNEKDEFLDVIYWIRQVIGFLIGIVWGVLSFKGFLAILIFVLLNVLVIYLYAISFQKIDEDQFGGVWEIVKEGFMTSLSTFLVSWIVVYSAISQ